jgi:DNA-binding beta-propeller fold protein YncE
LNSPNSLVISNGYIYVTNGFGNSISKIDILTGGVAGTWISGTITPTGLAINGDYMYVCDISNDTISRITISTISLETGWASGPTGGGLISLIIDSLYIYITNSNLTTISQLLLADGSMIDPNFITGLSGPYDITIKDNFFLCDKL